MDALEARLRLVELCVHTGPKFEAVVDMRVRFDELWAVVSEKTVAPVQKGVAR